MGVTATVSFGEESVTAGANVTVTGVAGTSALGSETVSGTSLFAVTGVNATGQATTTPTIESRYSVSGVAGTGNTGIVQIYTAIVADQTPNWTEVSAATTAWEDIDPSQTPNWTEIAA